MRKLLPIFFVLFLAATSYSQLAVVIGDDAFLRGSPVATGAVVDTLRPGTRVAIIKQQGPWFLVQATPFVGWMHGNSLKLTRSTKPPPTTPASQPTTVSTDPKSSEQPPVATDAKVKSEASAKTSPPDTTPAKEPQPPEADKRVYIRGPRGGCYYVRPDGRKVYGSHALCKEN